MADADCTYELDRIPELVAPVMAGEADLVLGSRLDSGRSAAPCRCSIASSARRR